MHRIQKLLPGVQSPESHEEMMGGWRHQTAWLLPRYKLAMSPQSVIALKIIG
jgi:hypothetical protein